MISLQYKAVDGDLAKTVSSFYHFSYRGNGASQLERADRAQFRFCLNDTGHYEFAAGHTRPSYPVTILGPTTAPVTAVCDEDITITGWGMQPAGWAKLMGRDAEKWTDDAFDARDIFGDNIMQIREKLIASMSKMEQQFSIMQEAAAKIHSNIGQAPFEFTNIVDSWLSNNVEHDITELVQQTGLSQRQLERVTKRYYGAPPKKLARKYRALRAAQMLAHGDNLDNSDLGLSFYDQSHLVREVKQFTGLTPGQLRSGKETLTKATMAGRKGLRGKVSKLISDS